MGTISFTMGLRPLGRIISPEVIMNLPLEVILSSVVDYFFGAMSYWRGFLRMVW